MTVMGQNGLLASCLCQDIFQLLGILVTCSVRFWYRSSLASGPMSVFSSLGSPQLTLLSLQISFSLNFSYTSLVIINLLGEKHTWPAFAHLVATAFQTARSISASCSTTNGSFPPSSITDLFKYRPATSEIYAPALDEPVKLTPTTLGFFITCYS